MTAELPPLRIDGAGRVGQVVVDGLVTHAHVGGRWPHITVTDYARWRPAHARSGLIPAAAVGEFKAATTVARLQAAGWPAHRTRACVADIRACPRADYEGGFALACADRHAIKHVTVLHAQQAGRGALAIGVGAGEAVLEWFTPGGSGYCCVHGHDAAWAQRQPCSPPATASTTAVLDDAGSEVLRKAGQLAAGLVSAYIATGRFPAGRGARLGAATTVDWFDHERDPHCAGPHDPPIGVAATLDLVDSAHEMRLHELVERIGPNAVYADRPLAWDWRCEACGARIHRLHVLHPAATCVHCRGGMRPGFERASGLSPAELRRLAGAGVPTLAAAGLADERLIRCERAGTVVWVRLPGAEHGTN